MPKIEIYKSNAFSFRLTLLNKGENYNISNTTTLLFTVKKSLIDDEVVLQKSIVGDGSNKIVITFTSADTNIEPGFYKCDIYNNTTKKTVMPPIDFIIKQVVGDSVVGGSV